MDADNAAIELSQVCKCYGGKAAVDSLSLKVPRGEVFGFAGENAAGKTTTIRMLLGHVKPTSGRVKVLGHDPSDSSQVHLLMARIGYVSESRGLYDWMRVREIMDFCGGVHGSTWDATYAEKLRVEYELDPQKQVRHLSQGKRALLMLLLATAHHPELLILDEPSSGLDPMARHEILEQVITIVKSEGRSVFFSSHLLDEVERVAGRVGFMKSGRLVALETPAKLHEKWRRVFVPWPEAAAIPALPTMRNIERRGGELVLTTNDYSARSLEQIHRLQPGGVRIEEMSLNDIFVATMRNPDLQPLEGPALANDLPAA